jgi:hypothetical protein
MNNVGLITLFSRDARITERLGWTCPQHWLFAIGDWLFVQPLMVIFLSPRFRRGGDVLLDHIPDGAGND